MFCKHCGKDIGKNKASFCKFCGGAIDGASKAKTALTPQKKNAYFTKWWPDMNVERNQIESARLASGVAVLIVIFTVLAVSLGEMGKEAFFDAVLFAIVAFFLWRISRVAAVAGLVLYILEVLYSISNGVERGVVSWIITALFILAFVNGVRATFAHNQKISE